MICRAYGDQQLFPHSHMAHVQGHAVKSAPCMKLPFFKFEYYRRMKNGLSPPDCLARVNLWLIVREWQSHIAAVDTTQHTEGLRRDSIERAHWLDRDSFIVSVRFLWPGQYRLPVGRDNRNSTGDPGKPLKVELTGEENVQIEWTDASSLSGGLGQSVNIFNASFRLHYIYIYIRLFKCLEHPSTPISSEPKNNKFTQIHSSEQT